MEKNNLHDGDDDDDVDVGTVTATEVMGTCGGTGGSCARALEISPDVNFCIAAVS